MRRAANDAAPIAYRLRLVERSADPYYLAEADVPDSLKTEWKAFLRYKMRIPAERDR